MCIRDRVGLQVSTDDDLPSQPVHTRLMPGEAIQLFGLGVFEGTNDAVDVSDRVEWKTSDDQVVSITQAGLATCLADGTSIISIKDSASNLDSTTTLGDATVECGGELGVLQVDPDDTAIDFPKSKQMKAFRVFTDGSKVEVTRSVNWTSSDPSVVSVVESGGDAGVATALADGTGPVTISVTDPVFGDSSNDPGGVNGLVKVRKTRVLLEIFPLSTQPVGGIYHGKVGDQISFRARVTFASGATQGVNLIPQWSSSNPTVVAMGSDAGLPVNAGKMLKVGQVTITARWPADDISSELTATVQVQVQ